MAMPRPTLSAVTFIFAAAVSIGSGAWAIDGATGASSEDMRIYVTAYAGAVELATAGVAQEVELGAVVGLPARIVTGADGSLGMVQQRTSISIAADSDVEIPEIAGRGQLIARLVQRRGNVFYDVETRPANKLNVETPYLVAVVKGTQFNVSVDDERTMIALFEGRLEIRTPDGGQSVELDAGEIAIRSSTDSTIRVLSMDAAVPQAQSSDGDEDSTLLGMDDDGLLRLGVERTALDGIASTELVDSSLIAAGADLGGASTSVDASIDLGASSTSIGFDAGADLDAGSVDLGLDTSADLGVGSVDLGLDSSTDLGAGSTDLGLDAGADLGAGSTDLGLDAGADLGLDTGADLGAGSADLGLDAGADLGGGGIDLGAEATLDLGTELTTEPLTDPDGGLLDLTPEPESGGELLPLGGL